MSRYKKLDILKFVGPYSKRFANLPDRYIRRAMQQIYWKNPPGLEYRPFIHQRTKFNFTTNRPWTNSFKMENAYGVPYNDPEIEPILQWSWFRGDRVEVLVGKDKGKQGIIKQIIEERNWVILEGLNTKIRIMGKTKTFPGIAMLEEQPLLVTTEIKLVDPSDLKTTSIEWRYTDDGEKVRVSTRTGRIIPIPPSHDETIDYKLPHLYKEGDKDTLLKHVEEITYKPALKTFEMEIMEKQGIKEDRIRKPTYWY